MARLAFTLLSCLVITVLVLESCSSGKKAYQRGNYFEAVMTSTNRLRRDPGHSKSSETLRESYPLAVAYFNDRANAAIASNAPFKWTIVVESYTSINVMYDEIRRSPGALKVIPNPVSYHDKLDEAKRNAAEENYSAGILAMTVGTRDKAKEAYHLFKQADAFVPGYKDVRDMIEAALWAATVKVMIEPVPVPRNVSVSAEFFDNKVSEYVHATSLSEFVKFYTLTEMQTLNVKPDHIVRLQFDDFTVGQVFLHEKEYALTRDSVVLATYVTPATGGGERRIDDKKDLTDKPGDTKDEKKGDPVVEKPKDPVDKPDEKPVDERKDDPKDDKPKDDQRDDKAGDQSDKAADKPKEKDPTDETKDEKIDEKDQVTVCHIPPGNTNARHTLVISKNALKAHLAHGDTEGSCDDQKDKGKPADKPSEKKEEKKSNDKNKGSGGNGGMAMVVHHQSVLLASSGNHDWLLFTSLDTVKVYGTVKATLYHSRKTITSKGTLNLQIIDARTGGVLAVEKIPGEYIWVSEWATFNGDERALTPRQLQLSKQREQIPPPTQDLFSGFAQPIYDRVITKIGEFYKGY